MGVSLPFEGHWLAASVVAMKKKNITEICISIFSIRSDQLWLLCYAIENIIILLILLTHKPWVRPDFWKVPTTNTPKWHIKKTKRKRWSFSPISRATLNSIHIPLCLLIRSDWMKIWLVAGLTAVAVSGVWRVLAVVQLLLLLASIELNNSWYWLRVTIKQLIY